jgi:hypothetical protein
MAKALVQNKVHKIDIVFHAISLFPTLWEDARPKWGASRPLLQVSALIFLVPCGIAAARGRGVVGRTLEVLRDDIIGDV